jgi:hypothetical protein
MLGPVNSILRSGWSRWGDWRSLWIIRGLGPVFRFGRNPAVRLFLGRKIPDTGDGAIFSRYGNGPTTVLDHPRMEFWFLAHPKNTRLPRNGSIQSLARVRCHVPADRRQRMGEPCQACAGAGQRQCVNETASARGDRLRPLFHRTRGTSRPVVLTKLPGRRWFQAPSSIGRALGKGAGRVLHQNTNTGQNLPRSRGML